MFCKVAKCYFGVAGVYLAYHGYNIWRQTKPSIFDSNSRRDLSYRLSDPLADAVIWPITLYRYCEKRYCVKND